MANNINYKKMFSLEGKCAVVTGGSGLLGSHFCSGLAAHGANVAVVDIHEGRAKELARKIATQYDVRSIGLGCDVSDPHAVKTMIRQVISDMGKIDVVHNNAAFKSSNLSAFFESTENYSIEQWREVMSVNLDGMFLVAQAAGAQMIDQGGGGSIIQTASIYGISGPDARIYEGSYYLGQEINTPPVYAASKGGVVALSRYLATTWATRGIRVNTLTPGGVESGQNDTFKEKYSYMTPMGRMAQPNEMVGALVYLASDASSYVTGQNIVVDGGWTAW